MFGITKTFCIFAMSKERNDNRAGRVPGNLKREKNENFRKRIFRD